MCVFFLTPSVCNNRGTNCGRFICKHNPAVDSCQNGIDCTSIEFRIAPDFVGVLGAEDTQRMDSEACLDCDRDRTAMLAQCKLELLQRQNRRLRNLLSKANDIIAQTQTDSMVLAGFDTTRPRLRLVQDWQAAVKHLIDSRNADEACYLSAAQSLQDKK